MTTYTEHDRQIWEEELEAFVPPRVFDAHIHLFNPAHMRERVGRAWSSADMETLQSWSQKLYPSRETHFLVLGSPAPGIDVQAHSDWAIQRVKQDPQSRMNRPVTPDCRVEDIRHDIETHGFIGLIVE